jgi:hypothetical protein
LAEPALGIAALDRFAALACFTFTVTANGASPSSAQGLGAWLNLEAIQILTHHTSAVVTAVVLFWLVGFVVQRLLHETIFKKIVLWLDEFVLVCLFIYFAYELFIYLWQRV